jgi:hypothetical protein
VYRKKYFVDSATIVGSGTRTKAGTTPALSTNCVIHAERIAEGNRPVLIQYRETPADGHIQVTPIRDGKRIKSLQIVCSCGRKATFEVQYEG